MQKISMKRVIFQAIGFITLLSVLWCALSQVNWLSIFQIDYVTEQTEKKLGDIVWSTVQKRMVVVNDPQIILPVDSLVTTLCKANNIARSDIKVHVIVSDEVNAYTLPDGHLVLNTALLCTVRDQQELAGVIAHEIAHSALKHVVKSLTKEVGIVALTAIVSNGTAPDIAVQAGQFLSSTAFDRKMEKEADLLAVELLQSANMDPTGLTRFLEQLASDESESQKYLSWMSTHPESKARIAYLKNADQNNKIVEYSTLLHVSTWQRLQESACAK